MHTLWRKHLKISENVKDSKVSTCAHFFSSSCFSFEQRIKKCSKYQRTWSDTSYTASLGTVDWQKKYFISFSFEQGQCVKGNAPNACCFQSWTENSKWLQWSRKDIHRCWERRADKKQNKNTHQVFPRKPLSRIVFKTPYDKTENVPNMTQAV